MKTRIFFFLLFFYSCYTDDEVPVSAFSSSPPKLGMVAWFKVEDFQDGKWKSSVGDFEMKIQEGSSAPKKFTATMKHGSVMPLTAIQGGADTKISFGRVIPHTYTICSLTRYAGEKRSRILSGGHDPPGLGKETWLHGHWAGRIGVAKYEEWGTYKFSIKDVLRDDWLVMCGTSLETGNILRANGRNVMHIFPGDGPFFLNINSGLPEDSSDWTVAEIITWNRRLRRHEMIDAERYLLNKLSENASSDEDKAASRTKKEDEKKKAEDKEAEPEYAVGNFVSTRDEFEKFLDNRKKLETQVGQVPRDSAKDDTNDDVLTSFSDREDDLPRNNMVAWYKYRDFDHKAKTWKSAVGSFEMKIIKGKDSLHALEMEGFGTVKEIGAVAGTAQTGISLGKVIPQDFTICSLTRYTGETQRRILTGSYGKDCESQQGNWFHGHWEGKLGVGHYEGWYTEYTTSREGLPTNPQDWLFMCGQNSVGALFRANGLSIRRDRRGDGPYFLNINVGGIPALRKEQQDASKKPDAEKTEAEKVSEKKGDETSDFAVAEVIVWNDRLSIEEIRKVENYFRDTLKTGNFKVAKVSDAEKEARRKAKLKAAQEAAQAKEKAQTQEEAAKEAELLLKQAAEAKKAKGQAKELEEKEKKSTWHSLEENKGDGFDTKEDQNPMLQFDVPAKPHDPPTPQQEADAKAAAIPKAAAAASPPAVSPGSEQAIAATEDSKAYDDDDDDEEANGTYDDPYDNQLYMAEETVAEDDTKEDDNPEEQPDEDAADPEENPDDDVGTYDDPYNNQLYMEDTETALGDDLLNELNDMDVPENYRMDLDKSLGDLDKSLVAAIREGDEELGIMDSKTETATGGDDEPKTEKVKSKKKKELVDNDAAQFGEFAHYLDEEEVGTDDEDDLGTYDDPYNNELYMLEEAVGDDDFFAADREFYRRHLKHKQFTWENFADEILKEDDDNEDALAQDEFDVKLDAMLERMWDEDEEEVMVGNRVVNNDDLELDDDLPTPVWDDLDQDVGDGEDGLEDSTTAFEKVLDTISKGSTKKKARKTRDLVKKKLADDVKVSFQMGGQKRNKKLEKKKKKLESAKNTKHFKKPDKQVYNPLGADDPKNGIDVDFDEVQVQTYNAIGGDDFKRKDDPNTEEEVAVGGSGLPSEGMVAWYQYTNFNLKKQSWKSSVGSHEMKVIAGVLRKETKKGHGARSSVGAVFGNWTEKVTFGPIISEFFTICTLSRYTGHYRNRLLQGSYANDDKAGNWVHGHWADRVGVAYYNDWVSDSKNKLKNREDWLLMCGQNSLHPIMHANGVDVANSLVRSHVYNLNINTGGCCSKEKTDWAVAEIITWDRHLRLGEVQKVERYLKRVLAEGVDFQELTVKDDPPVDLTTFRGQNTLEKNLKWWVGREHDLEQMKREQDDLSTKDLEDDKNKEEVDSTDKKVLSAEEEAKEKAKKLQEIKEEAKKEVLKEEAKKKESDKGKTTTSSDEEDDDDGTSNTSATTTDDDDDDDGTNKTSASTNNDDDDDDGTNKTSASTTDDDDDDDGTSKSSASTTDNDDDDANAPTTANSKKSGSSTKDDTANSEDDDTSSSTSDNADDTSTDDGDNAAQTAKEDKAAAKSNSSTSTKTDDGAKTATDADDDDDGDDSNSSTSTKTDDGAKTGTDADDDDDKVADTGPIKLFERTSGSEDDLDDDEPVDDFADEPYADPETEVAFDKEDDFEIALSLPKDSLMTLSEELSSFNYRLSVFFSLFLFGVSVMMFCCYHLYKQASFRGDALQVVLLDEQSGSDEDD